MTLTFQTHPIDLILLDIEGTISSQRYVLDVLYPFARERIPVFVAKHPDHPVVQRALKETAERIEPGQDPVAALIAWQDADQKVPPLKLLQGLVWEEGYNEGAFKGHIYDDAHAALEGWRKAGVPMHIFSSGSVKAQVEFFQNSNRGDLRPYFGRHYDTDIGAKVVPESYLKIAADLGAAPDRILFLTDNPREVTAARQAGVHVVQVIRDASVKPNEAGAPIVAEFDQLRDLVAFG
ncbi:MAG: acireductone synthase [Inquilinus sp.]|uniref:acireductone synthase n=1 Tax=Inquilinus sp. TaxID=1932117 RepID=UPI003F3373C2